MAAASWECVLETKSDEAEVKKEERKTTFWSIFLKNNFIEV